MVEQELSFIDIGVTGLIIAVAAFYLYRRFARKKSPCGGGCGGCGGSSPQPKK
ncbi:FeoB-associated Cys-rich membrane protein [Vibrio sonorensis]|uniref:FeoB-associated Cys-rich membrane protein n=1 Tax=Vibrio sonorensis TaxID=1004316 RepID=UPI0009FE0C6E|nr:FeoB-associated Cys-rich membrane protein [Vibrio sonorensis]